MEILYYIQVILLLIPLYYVFNLWANAVKEDLNYKES